MPSFLAALRQDIHATRWVLIPWLVMHVLWFFSYPGLLNQNPNGFETAFSTYYVFSIVGWLVLVPLLFYSHPLGDPNAEWRTRPMRGSVVGLEKVVLGIFMLVAIPTLIELTNDPFHRLQFYASPIPAWVTIAGRNLIGFAGFLYLASQTSSIRRFFGYMVFLGFFGALATFGEGPPDPFAGSRFGITSVALGVLILVTGSFTLTVAQYRGMSKMTNQLTMGSLIGIVSALPWFFPNYLTQPSELKSTDTSISITSAEPFEYAYRTFHFKDGLNGRERTAVDRTRSMFRLQVEYDDLDPANAWILSPWDQMGSPSLAGGPSSGLILNPELLRQLGIPSYQISPVIDGTIIQERNRFPYSRMGNQNLKKEITQFGFTFAQTKFLELADFSLQSLGEKTAPSGLRIQVTDLGSPLDQPLLAINPTMPPPQHPDFMLNWLPEARDGANRRRVYSDPLLLLVDDVNRRAHVLLQPENLMKELRSYRRVSGFRYAKSLPDWDTPLENLRLKVFQVTVTGYIRFESEIPPRR